MAAGQHSADDLSENSQRPKSQRTQRDHERPVKENAGEVEKNAVWGALPGLTRSDKPRSVEVSTPELGRKAQVGRTGRSSCWAESVDVVPPGPNGLPRSSERSDLQSSRFTSTNREQ